ncbi:MAG TPA: hypothetical protein VKA34_17400 [Balneolales bacterium]|nr:hypothetical protein [Balneolales bacterium]
MQYLDARTDKMLEWKLVNRNTGSSLHFCGDYILVSVLGGMIWFFRFNGNTLTVKPKVKLQK